MRTLILFLVLTASVNAQAKPTQSSLQMKEPVIGIVKGPDGKMYAVRKKVQSISLNNPANPGREYLDNTGRTGKERAAKSANKFHYTPL
jgi:hypothetical protein